MRFKRASIEIVARGTDYAAGWEIGFNHGRERFCGHLRDRRPPQHINYDPRNWKRKEIWQSGYRQGLIDRRRSKTVYVVCRDKEDTIVCHTFVGISHSRAITNVQKKGCKALSPGYFQVQTGEGPVHKIY